MKVSLSCIVACSASLLVSTEAFAPNHVFERSSTSLNVLGKVKKLFKTSTAKKARGSGYGPPLDNISEAVGNTPMVKLNDRMCPPGRTIYAKAEYFNPLSSVKDRLALSMIETA